jgi:hypothetical protein
MHTGLVSAEPMTTHPGSSTVVNEQRVRLHHDVLEASVFTIVIVVVGVGDDRDGRSKSGAGEHPRAFTRHTGEAPYLPGICMNDRTIEQAAKVVELDALRLVVAASTGAPRTWNPRCFVDRYGGDNDRMTLRTQVGSESPNPACSSPNTDLGLGPPSRSPS